MTRDRMLETRLEFLLKHGSLACSLIIAIGMVLNALEVTVPSIDLVTIGIVGFIALPVLRIITMLSHYISAKDVPMLRVVSLVLALVIAGLILGILWR